MNAKNASYFISGKGLKMWFNGNVYQNPDLAAVEEGQRLSGSFKNVKVSKVVFGKKTEVLFKAPTEKEQTQLRLKNCFCPQPRCFCRANA